MNSVTHNTFLYTGASIIQKALSFVYFIFLGRTYGPEGFGQYTFALSFVAVFSIIVDGGLTPVLVRACAQDQTHSRAWLGRVLGYKAIITFITLLVMALVVWWGSERAFAVWPLIALAATAMLMDTVNVTVYGVLRGYQTLWYESVGIIASQTFVLVCGVVIFFTHPTVHWAVGALVGGSVLHSAIGWLGVRRVSGRTALTAQVPPARELIREAVPFALAGIFARLYSFFDSFFLATITKAQGYAVVGVYAAANKFTFAFQFIPLTLVASLYPALSHATDTETRARLWLSAQRYVLLCAGAVVAVLISTRYFLLGTAGRGFESGALSLIVLALSLPWAFMSYPNGSLLNALHLQRLQTTAMGVTVVVNILANVLLAPRYGAVGAALAALLGNFTLWIVGAYFVHTRVSDLPIPALGKCIAGVCLSAFVGAVIGSWWADSVAPQLTRHGAILIQLISTATVSAVSFLGTCWLVRAITRDEIAVMWHRIRTRI